MIYLDFFNLTHRPFAVQPDSEFLFWTTPHKDAFDKLRATVLSHAPFTLLTGPIGAGKTLLISALLSDREIEKAFRVSLLSHPKGDAEVMLRHLILAFDGQSGSADPWAALIRAIDKVQSTGAAPLIIVDEAQSLSAEGADILAQLASGSTKGLQPVAILCVGQPELRQKIETPDFRALRALLGSSVDLKTLSLQDVGPYINSRLHTAGASKDAVIFEPDTFPIIHKATGGTPRLINKLCEVCLFLAGENREKTITAQSLNRILEKFIDPDTLTLTGGIKELGSVSPAADPSDVVVLREPAPKLRPQTKAPPPPAATTPPAAQRAAVPDRVAPPSKPRSKAWAAAALAACVALLAVFFTSANRPAASDGEPSNTASPVQPQPVAASQPAQDTATETAIAQFPEVAPDLPELQRATDDAPDAAASYFDAAIASTEPRQTAIAFTRAAIRGHGRSALYLGQIFETGDGVSFAPEVAEKWYRLAENPNTMPNVDQPFAPSADGRAYPLFSLAANDAAEFIWDGKAALFQLQIGDRSGTPIAQLATPLTAALVKLPENAAVWRVLPQTGNTPDWHPIERAQAN